MTTLERLTTALADRYRLDREIGQGGMATVYLAHDLRHDRDVAIKVLHPDLGTALGSGRFLSEIRVTARLQHPHILPLLDSGDADGLLYYVMPLVTGESLRTRLDRERQLPISDAIRIGCDVAGALDYAHRQQVIHRDIKPDNILLHDGSALVADFGIALAVQAAGGERMTQTGLSLGTPQYMSPEQAMGERTVDARSDIYALGAVVYEMLSGEPPHVANSAQQVILKVIAEPAAPITKMRKSVPANVAAAVAVALEKLPADRFASGQDFSSALGNPAFTSGRADASAAATTGVPLRGRTMVRLATAGTLASAIVASLIWKGSTRADEVPVVRAELNILARTDTGVSVNALDVSPDGSMIVYSVFSAREREPRLYLRHLNDRMARPIPGTEGATFPVFSPDGKSIAYAHGSNVIRRILVSGAGGQNLVQGTERSAFVKLRWSSDGFIYYDDDLVTGFSRVSEQGGAPTVFLKTGDPENPEPLPGGRQVLYTECCAANADVRVVNVETGETRPLGLRANSVRYVAPGYLLLLGGDALRAVAFDARTLAVDGEPKIVLDSATTSGSITRIGVSSNGTAAYLVQQDVLGERQRVMLVGLQGKEQRLPLDEALYGAVRFSPDGRRVAFLSASSDSQSVFRVAVHDLVVGTTSVLLRGVGDASGLRWLPNGQDLILGVRADQDSLAYLVRARTTGSGGVDTLWRRRVASSASEFLSPLSVTRGGTDVLLARYRPNTANASGDLVVASLGSVLGAPREYLVANWDERSGDLSPDNRWVVYLSTEEAPPTASFQTKVYVRSFPQAGERHAISDTIGFLPRWSPDGKTIYYWRGRTLVAASVTTVPTFRVSARRNLFTRATFTDAYDVSPDGTRFVMTAPAVAAAPAEPPKLVVVVNWIEELRVKLGRRR
jgi:eukaryotic-like serine/threonine-protein kinase